MNKTDKSLNFSNLPLELTTVRRLHLLRWETLIILTGDARQPKIVVLLDICLWRSKVIQASKSSFHCVAPLGQILTQLTCLGKWVAVSGMALEWFKSYIKDKTLYICVGK